MKLNQKTWYIILIINGLLWGTQHPPIKVLSKEYGPIALNLLRFSFATFALLPFIARNKVRIVKKDLLIVSILAFIGIYLFGIFNVAGVQLSTATNNSILLNSWPLMLVLSAPIFIGEKIHKKSIIGMLIGLIGVIMVLTNGMGIGGLIRSEFFRGNILILISALCVAIQSMFNKRYIEKYGGLEVAFWGVAVGTFLFLVSSIVTGDIALVGKIDLNTFLLLIWIGVITTAITWIIWYEGIRQIGLVNTSAFILLIPLSGVIASRLLLREPLTLYTVTGIMLILSGIFVVQNKSAKSAISDSKLRK